MANEDLIDNGEGLEDDEKDIEGNQEAEEREIGQDGEKSNVSTQDTEYATPMSSPSASFIAGGRCALLQGRLAVARRHVSQSSGPTAASSSSATFSSTPNHTTPFLPPANSGFHHLNTDPSRPTPLWARPPAGTPTAPRNFGWLLDPPNVSPLTRASTAPTPRPSTHRHMTQQNAAAFQRHIGNIAGEETTTRHKAAPPTLPEPEYPQHTLLLQPKKGENAADNKRRVERNEIALERAIRQHKEECQQDQLERDREWQTLHQRLACLESQPPAAVFDSGRPLQATESCGREGTEANIVDLAMQQIHTQQQFMTQMMDWQLQWSAQHAFRDSSPQERDPPLHGTFHDDVYRIAQLHPQSCRGTTTVGNLQVPLENSTVDGHGDELEYIDVAPRSNDNKEDTLAGSPLELDEVSMGDDDESNADLPLEAECGEMAQENQPHASTSTTLSNERLSSSLFQWLSSTPQSDSPARDTGARSTTAVLTRLIGWAGLCYTGEKPVLLVNPTQLCGQSCKVGSGIRQRPGSKSHTLGALVFKDSRKGGKLCDTIPLTFWKNARGAWTYAKQFVELWNEHAHYVPEAANLVAEVDVSTPFLRNCMNVDNNGPDDNECDNALGDHDFHMLSWNIGGKPEIVLRDNAMCKEMQSYDVVMLQETHLYEAPDVQQALNTLGEE
ncbi:hypothetical protein PQX77_001997 [Marasmius sp. AFHP31]|nr:hypothetical protein PQX77_001997 [Marasmius sp. AFHP31]